MNISKKQDGNSVTIAIEGRLDTTTAPQLEAELKTVTGSAETLILDFEKLEYISSAGLRVLLATHKEMSGKGKLEIINANSDISEVFEITGFCDILTIK